MNNLNPKIFIPCVLLYLLVIMLCFARADTWKLTSYDSCQLCCGKTDGITASRYKAQYGYVACNWLAFGTLVEIEGLGVFKVMDRGAKSLFGSKTNHIKHLDIWLPTHKQARLFGIQYRKVVILNEKH